MKAWIIVLLVLLGLVLALSGTVQAASCPPYFDFGCVVSGSSRSAGLSVVNNAALDGATGV